jgi:hypothetical protein
MEDEEKCEHSENGMCVYYEDSDLQCDGCIDKQNNCAVYVGYFQQ